MKILVLGSLNIDRVYRVHNFVRPKETIHAQSFICTCGGKGFNQSIALARAGSKIVFAGIAGVDGSMLIEMLRNEGIDTSLMRQSPNANGHTIIQVSDYGENCILVAAGANGETSKQYICAWSGCSARPTKTLVKIPHFAEAEKEPLSRKILGKAAQNAVGKGTGPSNLPKPILASFCHASKNGRKKARK